MDLIKSHWKTAAPLKRKRQALFDFFLLRSL
jgi:hypothetical protein